MNEIDREAIARLAAQSVARRSGKLADLEDLEQEARVAIYKAEQKYNPALSELGPYLWYAARYACIDWLRKTYGRDTRRTPERIGDRDFALEDHAIDLIDRADSARRAQELADAYMAEDSQRAAERSAPKPERVQRRPRVPRQPLTAGPYQYGLLSYERFGQALMVRHVSGYILMLPLGDLRHVLDLIAKKESSDEQHQPDAAQPSPDP